MRDGTPFLVPRRIRDRLAREVARLRREIAEEVADRTACAVGEPGDVADAAQGRAWIEAVVAALPVQSERER
jgi:hypothetical protein